MYGMSFKMAQIKDHDKMSQDNGIRPFSRCYRQKNPISESSLMKKCKTTLKYTFVCLAPSLTQRKSDHFWTCSKLLKQLIATSKKIFELPKSSARNTRAN